MAFGKRKKVVRRLKISKPSSKSNVKKPSIIPQAIRECTEAIHAINLMLMESFSSAPSYIKGELEDAKKAMVRALRHLTDKIEPDVKTPIVGFEQLSPDAQQTLIFAQESITDNCLDESIISSNEIEMVEEGKLGIEVHEDGMYLTASNFEFSVAGAGVIRVNSSVKLPPTELRIYAK